MLGSHVSDNTYVVAAMIIVQTMQHKKKHGKSTILFDGSAEPLKTETAIKPSQSISTTVAVYAGGRNVTQSQIASGVRDRFTRILSDII
ncbi:hypothetical protein [Oleidesulfovibrio sp.]|uniref:hypothetical protein n=1 Tax=Oleidesulfovibrio sp. TaxID=2909707 RepID=UPI003A8B9611